MFFFVDFSQRVFEESTTLSKVSATEAVRKRDYLWTTSELAGLPPESPGTPEVVQVVLDYL